MIIRIVDPTEPGLQANVYLTPIFVRVFQRQFPFLLKLLHRSCSFVSTTVLVAIGFSIAGCTRTLPSTPPRPTPPLPQPEPVIPVVIPTALVLRPDSVSYNVISTIITSDLPLSSNAKRDSATYQEFLHTILTIARDSSLHLSVRSDSGYPLPPGREITPELASTPRTSLVVMVHRHPRSPTILTDTMPLTCGSTTTFASPLMPMLVVRSLLNRTREPHIQRDSLSYTTCQAGIVTQNRFNISSAPVFSSTSVSQGDSSQFEIRGTLIADSTRILPMRITGDIAGTASVAAPVLPRTLPRYVTITLDLDLKFDSTIRTQHLRQHVITRYELRH